MWYGQLVIGPPGSGKSTYCNGMQQMLRALHRPHIVVNLDPANDFLPYDCAVNLRDLIDHKEVMEKHRLGPNGGMSLLSSLLSSLVLLFVLQLSFLLSFSLLSFPVSASSSSLVLSSSVSLFSPRWPLPRTRLLLNTHPVEAARPSAATHTATLSCRQPLSVPAELST
ncbi:putative ATP binding protein [Toxoplasma gondii p89]|uniref:GPN-loop GTPase 2 n=2 Tax=Toxoplasma gondii TaxID=5811 RepID=A0A2G8XW16_TOXGO|nr:putative ATP binding protein [Toxoplasma gondii p89]PIL99205.1 ATP-binding protein [Toxoplasma gondii COUG]